MWTLTAKTHWDRIAALAEPVFWEMDIPAKVRKNFIKKHTVLIKQLCRCKVLFLWAFFDYYFIRSEIVSRQQFIIYYSGFPRETLEVQIRFFFFFGFSHKTQFHYSACVKCNRMRRMNPRAHGLKQWLPSWTIPCLMYAKKFDGYYAQYIYKVTPRSR